MAAPDVSEPPSGGENASKIGWKESNAKQHVIKLIKDGVIPLENHVKGSGHPKPKQIFENFCKPDPSFKDFMDYKKLKFPSKLASIRNALALNSGNKKIGWDKSDAKKHVQKLVKDGTIPTEHYVKGSGHLKPKQIFETFCKPDPSFKDFMDYKRINFSSNLKNIRDDFAWKYERKKSDEEALAHDRLIYPIPTHDGYGVLRWTGSEAQQLLKEHLNVGLYPEKKPKLLWETYAAYHRDFPLENFRKHIHQEIKARKWKDQWCTKDYYAD